jgi:hypothetical protein
MLEKHSRFKFAKLFVESAQSYREKGGKASAQPTFSDEFVM